MKLKRFDELNEGIGRSTKKYEDEPSYFSRYKEEDDEKPKKDRTDLNDFIEREFDDEPMSGFEIKGYNQAIDDILLLIVDNKIKGIQRTIPPEALIHVFKKLKK